MDAFPKALLAHRHAAAVRFGSHAGDHLEHISTMFGEEARRFFLSGIARRPRPPRSGLQGRRCGSPQTRHHPRRLSPRTQASCIFGQAGAVHLRARAAQRRHRRNQGGTDGHRRRHATVASYARRPMLSLNPRERLEIRSGSRGREAPAVRHPLQRATVYEHGALRCRGQHVWLRRERI